MEMVAERINDDFSRHLSAAIGCLVRETVKEVVAEMEEQRLAAKRENPIQEEHPHQQEYMTRKEVMTLLKRCDSTMTKWAAWLSGAVLRGRKVPLSQVGCDETRRKIGGRYGKAIGVPDGYISASAPADHRGHSP